MKTYRCRAIAVGVLLIICAVTSILGAAPLGSTLDGHDYLTTLATSDNRVILAALIEFAWAAAGAGIAIGLYPIIREHNRALAPGAGAGRVAEGVLVPIGTRPGRKPQGVEVKKLLAVVTAALAMASGGVVVSEPANAALSPKVSVASTSIITHTRTRMTYRATVTHAGTLRSIGMTYPPGTTGRAHVVGTGRLYGAGRNAMVWVAAHPIYVKVGTRLAIPVDGFTNTSTPGTYRLGFRAAMGRTILSAGYGYLSLKNAAPAAPIHTPPPTTPLAYVAIPAISSGCPTSYPTVSEENSKTGSSDWTIASATSPVEMFANQTSAVCGDTVKVRVNSAKPVTLSAYRMGYYGGAGARKVWTSAAQVPADEQPAPTTGTKSLEVSASAWSANADIPITGDWIPGVYLVKADDGTDATYAPLTVRDDTRKHAVLIEQATATWAAYDNWGGHNFYNGSGTLTYDRPYSEGQGSGQFLTLEQGLVYWAEQHGIDATYWTDEDLHAYGSEIAKRADTFILPAHDEYFSEEMRHALTDAIANGVNVINLGSDAVYRRITFTDSSLREFSLDRSDYPASSTFRAWGLPWNEQPVLGAQYQCAPTGALTAEGNWLWSGIAAGTKVEGLTNGENDEHVSDVPSPAVSILATGPAACRTGRWTRADVTAYVASSGAHVFDGSSFAYSCFLVARCPSNWFEPDGTTPLSVSASDSAVVSQMMTNLMGWVGVPVTAPRAGLRTTQQAPVQVSPPRLAVTKEPGE